MNHSTITPDTNTATIDPAVTYESPAALAADGCLSVGERLALLRRWDHDVREEVVARGEGMPGPSPSAGLAEIAAAINALEPKPRAPASTPTQHGSVPVAEHSSSSGAEATAESSTDRADVPLAEIPLDRPRGEALRRRPSTAAVFGLGFLAVGIGALAALLEAPTGIAIGGGLLALAVLYAFAPRPKN